jgi:hypothetical protein
MGSPGPLKEGETAGSPRSHRPEGRPRDMINRHPDQRRAFAGGWAWHRDVEEDMTEKVVLSRLRLAYRQRQSGFKGQEVEVKRLEGKEGRPIVEIREGSGWRWTVWPGEERKGDEVKDVPRRCDPLSATCVSLDSSQEFVIHKIPLSASPPAARCPTSSRTMP